MWVATALRRRAVVVVRRLVCAFGPLKVDVKVMIRKTLGHIMFLEFLLSSVCSTSCWQRASFSVSAHLGKVVANSHEVTLVVSMFARYGECGNRRLREIVDQFLVAPIPSEGTSGSLLDVLPLFPQLVSVWVRWRATSELSCRKLI